VYFLASARLGFRPWRDADLSLATDLWSDTEVTRWIGGPLSPAAAAERLAAEIATHAEAGIQYWPIFQLADAAHVEGSTAKAPNAFDREAAKIAKTRARKSSALSRRSREEQGHQGLATGHAARRLLAQGRREREAYPERISSRPWRLRGQPAERLALWRFKQGLAD
jgi:hypothetical protein